LTAKKVWKLAGVDNLKKRGVAKENAFLLCTIVSRPIKAQSSKKDHQKWSFAKHPIPAHPSGRKG